MKAQKLILVIFTFALLNGCGDKSEKIFDSDTKLSGITTESGLPSTTKKVVQDTKTKQVSLDLNVPVLKERMIIRTGTMNLETENFDESEKAIKDLASRFSGYITNSGSSVNTSGKKQGTIEARIPSQNYDSFVSEAGKSGKVMSVNINGNDITEEYIDIDARCKTQKALEERLIKLLEEKTARLTDVVEVEEKLADVRSQIESMEGRMRFLKSQSDFSTLTVSLFEPSLLQTSTGGGFFYEIEEAFGKGLNGFTEVLSGLITFIVAFSPVFIIGLLLYVTLRRYFRNRKIKKEVVQAGII
jgi:major membrane immunogen (membrane-anchored lipoprotein)